MNERTKTLCQEAFTEAHESRIGPDGLVRSDGNPYIFYEKFAELIVKECISIVDEQKECLHEEQKYWHDRDYGYALAVYDASKGIKQFFGVEE